MLTRSFSAIVFSFFVLLTPASSQDLESFIPAAFALLDTASGDINRDGKKDLLVILKHINEADSVDAARPLLILFGKDRDTYSLAARNDSVVFCKGCGGVFGDPYAGMTVKKNFFSIEHYGGSSWRWTRIITFRYDTGSRQILLHRDAGESFHTSDPNQAKQHVYNKASFGKLLFTKYTSNKGW